MQYVQINKETTTTTKKKLRIGIHQFNICIIQFITSELSFNLMLLVREFSLLRLMLKS